MNIVNKILLRRKNLLMIEPHDQIYDQTKNEKALVVTMMKNVQSLGYTFSKELFKILSHLNRDELEAFYTDLIPALKELVGADVAYSPMYPNFPSQVAEMDSVELFLNAIIHYWSFGTLMPEYEKDERLPLIDANKMALLSVGKHEDIMEIFKNLASSKTSLSAQDKEDITNILKNCSDYMNYLPDEIPLKENVALIGKLIIEEAPVKTSAVIKKYFKTATDVLRLITALSDGDISLASRTKYRNLNRNERRIILDLLSNCGDVLEDLYRYKYEWIRIGEIIHPGEYWGYCRYKKVRDAFNILRNEKKPLMFRGEVQAAILRKDIISAVDLLKEKPGEFARQLDKLLRETMGNRFKNTQQFILQSFKEVSKDVSAPVLLQVRQHFVERMAETPNPIRVFFPKGNLAKAISIKNELPIIDKTVCQNVAKICRDALIEQYKNKEAMGKVYVDPELKNYLVPFSQRSASSSTKSVVRGSQLPIKPDTTAVRAFIWWTNTLGGRVDIDLSATIYDNDWNYVEHISYTRLQSGKMKAYHSGDITNGGNIAGKGVAEFLDVDIDAVAENGRYIVYQVYNYTGQSFSKLENCRFGWMEREDVDSGEIFEPTTVNMIMDVNADGKTAIPVIFDCVERKFIWCDMHLGIDNCHRGGINLESNISSVTATCYAMTHLNKPNIYDLVMLNTLARGTVVKDRNDADIIFSNDKTVPYEIIVKRDPNTGVEECVIKDKTDIPIITSFDIDYYVGQLL